MRPFIYQRAKDVPDAVKAAAPLPTPSQPENVTIVREPASGFLAGGTTLVDLMKLDVMRPSRLIDINTLQASLGAVEAVSDGLRLGALARMGDVADNALIKRDYPVIAQSLQLAASQQIRNMASLGGNVLQRTRCSYFRDTSYSNCNKRDPGSGCAALEGMNRPHAVLGGSDRCIATYPGDFAQALIALDAQIEIAGAKGTRTLPFADLHRQPGDAPHIETALAPGELITGFAIPAGPWRRSLYLKVRDRQSYEFALASAAIALDIRDGVVKDARVALGGVATVPWRARAAEEAVKGQRIDEKIAAKAAEAAFAGARGREHNGFKIALGKQTVIRALLQAAAMEA